MNNDFKRFFTPNKYLWKYVDKTNKEINRARSVRSCNLEEREEKLDHIIDNSNSLLDFSISFTKTVVRLSFVLFMVVNVFVLIMVLINYINSRELSYLDTLITESYGMLRDVIAAYIIKAATENTFKIVFSVLSDFLEKKYDIHMDDKPTNFDDYYYDNGMDIEPIDDPGYEFTDDTGENEVEDDPSNQYDSGIEYIEEDKE